MLQKAAPEFTTDWFQISRSVWESLIPRRKPARILEIGSYEGASACFVVQKLANEQQIEIHCIDTWEGSVETKERDMGAVERRFDMNMAIVTEAATHEVKLTKHKGRSDLVLSRLLAEGYAGYFDLVYVDGSHQAPDVLCDAVLGFRLCRTGGVMVFDDYLWRDPSDPAKNVMRTPKPAIDAFTNIYSDKIRFFSAALYQVYLEKLSD
ncbi:MAG: class I SAM-dependent methyltransferase [Nisaea sp.]|jgi:predicted O-methyltransferase YrrM|uniref:class I SAM-dependent methyltransferase n=1 Tax=Nisaea sp. TaxID=2024842 RepID=UPI001B033E71|nr:class I SAM-dependent methyltransferase [Nisaea sp.]MBO6560799.1 class I SAM-dependent methyltransferase [Nisaea sp.]